MTAKFTPGPWIIKGYSIHGGDNRVRVAEINPPHPKARGRERAEEREYCDGNARLIAAAPDLLHALEALLDMDISYQRGPKVQVAESAARAAVAKARGAQ
jgi:hypothetical protein